MIDADNQVSNKAKVRLNKLHTAPSQYINFQLRVSERTKQAELRAVTRLIDYGTAKNLNLVTKEQHRAFLYIANFESSSADSVSLLNTIPCPAPPNLPVTRLATYSST
jgi:hypothetical protein